jgi:hypothetical protein
LRFAPPYRLLTVVAARQQSELEFSWAGCNVKSGSPFDYCALQDFGFTATATQFQLLGTDGANGKHLLWELRMHRRKTLNPPFRVQCACFENLLTLYYAAYCRDVARVRAVIVHLNIELLMFAQTSTVLSYCEQSFDLPTRASV